MAFDVREHLDRLRGRDTAWLVARCEELTVEERRIHVERLAVLAVLDERRAVGPGLAAASGVSDATVRRELETARQLESLPQVAAAAHAGALSAEQLAPTVELADEDTDGQWAARAASASPIALARMAREQRVPTREESMARRQARYLRKWRDEGRGMLRGEFAIPMEHGGAEVEAVFDALAEQMRPEKGHAWEPLDRRQADVLIGLAQSVLDEPRAEQPTLGAPVALHVQVPLTGPATLCGTPLPDEWVEAARGMATVEITVIDDHAQPLATDRRRPVISPRRRQAVIRRDGHCRWPGCRRRLRLQVHHLVPASWGGSDEVANLAAVCPAHHALLVPHGDLWLEGNPNLPDGLTLRQVDTTERDRGRERRRPEPAAR